MSLKPETIAQIQTLLQANPALLAEVRSSAKLSEAAASLAKAAAAKGVEISTSDLLEHFETAAKQATMSDSELEQVAGGSIEFDMTDPQVALKLEQLSQGLITAGGGAGLIKSMMDASDALVQKI